MAQYVALTSYGDGYYVVFVGDKHKRRSTVEQEARKILCGTYWDLPKPIDIDTELKNLIVVPKSVAVKVYRKEWNTWINSSLYPEDEE